MTLRINGTIYIILSIDGQKPKFKVDLRISKNVLTFINLTLSSGLKSIVYGSFSSPFYFIYFLFLASSILNSYLLILLI